MVISQLLLLLLGRPCLSKATQIFLIMVTFPGGSSGASLFRTPARANRSLRRDQPRLRGADGGVNRHPRVLPRGDRPSDTRPARFATLSLDVCAKSLEIELQHNSSAPITFRYQPFSFALTAAVRSRPLAPGTAPRHHDLLSAVAHGSGGLPRAADPSSAGNPRLAAPRSHQSRPHPPASADPLQSTAAAGPGQTVRAPSLFKRRALASATFQSQPFSRSTASARAPGCRREAPEGRFVGTRGVSHQLLIGKGGYLFSGTLDGKRVLEAEGLRPTDNANNWEYEGSWTRFRAACVPDPSRD
jgi:hypothetical protein